MAVCADAFRIFFSEIRMITENAANEFYHRAVAAAIRKPHLAGTTSRNIVQRTCSK